MGIAASTAGIVCGEERGFIGRACRPRDDCKRGPRLRVQRIVITRLLALGSIFQCREAQATFYRPAPIAQRYYC